MRNSKFVCEIVFLEVSALDYMFLKEDIEDDLRLICDELKEMGVHLFECSNYDIKEPIILNMLEIFDAIFCDIEPDMYLYIYSFENEYKKVNKYGKIIFKYKMRTQILNHTQN